jgi:hypothetical protein
MSVFIIDPKRKPPAGPKATDAEADDLYRTMIAYSGAYSIEGSKVIHKIEESWSRKFGQRDKWSYCLMAGTLCPSDQERP